MNDQVTQKNKETPQRLKEHTLPKILLVDDAQANLYSMKYVLEDISASIYTAQSGDEALAMVLRHEFALILMDVHMPGMDGYETATLIHNDAKSKHTPIIFVTSISKDEGHLFRGYKSGAVDYLYKPIKATVLYSKINVFLDLYKHQAALKAEIAHRKAIENALKKSEERVRLLLEHTGEGIFGIDTEYNFDFCNPAALTILGYEDAGELVGQPISLLFRSRETHKRYKHRPCLQTTDILSESLYRDDERFIRKDGVMIPVEIRSQPILRDGKTVGVVVSFNEISERLEAQARLYHLAHHDVLTNLPNRLLLIERLNQAITRTRWHQRNIAVLFIDLDRFKIVNDHLGHEIGDRLLEQIAARLVNLVRDGDTVARLGGDEFSIILNDIADPSHIRPLCEKILESINQAVMIDDHELFTSASIGISLFPNHGDSPNALLKKADNAMYRAKRAGKNNYQFYSDEGREPFIINRLTLETELRHALERDEFELYYQPQLGLKSGKLIGLESLLRWRHPRHGMIPPSHIIPILEETGMVNEVGNWTLNTACKQAKTWQSSLTNFNDSTITVNLSVRQFKNSKFAQVVETILQKNDFNPSKLELEITESLLIENISLTVQILNELNEMGIGIAIDDFGTGYSSMRYLKRLPVDRLKIDRSFVSDITVSSDDAAITNAIISLAHNLGQKVIAEGVETMAQLNYLVTQQCDEIQGFLYSPPLPSSEIQVLLQSKDQNWIDRLQNRQHHTS